MKNNKWKAFTLVELIVVLSILAILSTLWFVAYTDYLKGVRDSSRIQQMSWIHKALSLYSTRSRLPFPEKAISIVSGVNPVWGQWYADEGVLNTIKFSDGGMDPKNNQPYTYFMSEDRKYAQLLWFFEENNSRDLITLNPKVNADETIDYSSLNPYVVGAELWVLIEEDTRIPLQEIKEGTYDILSTNDLLVSFASNASITTGSGSELIWMVPNLTCKNILNSLGSADDGIYKINLNGDKQLEVYCDMTTDGWGWTFVAHIDNDTEWKDIYFNSVTWIYNSSRIDTDKLYSLNMKDFNHTEMIVTYDTPDIITANNQNRYLQFKYSRDADGFFMWPLMPGCSWNQLLGSSGEFYYKTSISSEYIYSTNSQCNEGFWGLRPTPHDGIYIIAFRQVDWNSSWTRYDSRAWWIESGDSWYDVNWHYDSWIYVR